MSFREIAITIRATNRASAAFNQIGQDATSLAARVKNLGSALVGIGASGTAIGYIANSFGILNDQQARAFSSAMMVVSAMGMLLRTETGLAVAHKVYAAACAFATMVQNTLNISYATFLALTGVGVAVIVAAAAAMYTFANSMNSATSSVQNFNSAAAETPVNTRRIQRSGQAATSSSRGGYDNEAAFYRRGVE
jgi:hypothetical protein